jgi:hypothetical protein
MQILKTVPTVPRSNRSLQTIRRSVLRSNRSVQTVLRSVHRSDRSVQTVQRSTGVVVHFRVCRTLWNVRIRISISYGKVKV